MGRHAFQPLASRGRHVVLAILCTFALSSLLSVGLSVWSTARSKNKAAVGEALLDGARRPPSQVTTTTSPCRGKGIASPAASSSRRGGWRTT
jgi:hypothetical protein